MKEIISERLKLLASAQECMMSVADIMDHLENNQLTLEKRTFDIINISDTVLNLSKEACNLDVERYKLRQELDQKLDESKNLNGLLREKEEALHKIKEASFTANDISHNLEREVANQRLVIECLRGSIVQISQCVNSTVACADLLLSENDNN